MAVRLDLAPDLVIWHGDVREALKQIPDESVQCVVTSPPYLGLRSYLPDHHPDKDKEIGFGQSLDEYVQTMVEVFREVRRVLRKDGTVWLNIGDSYNGSGGAGGDYYEGGLREGQPAYPGRRIVGLKPKDLCMVPARVALALQEDGWWVRSRITWCKRAPMPESVTDRPTSATEDIYLLTKSPRYYYDAEAVREPTSGSYNGSSFTKGKTLEARQHLAAVGQGERHERPGRNMWNYWLLSPEPFPEAHFAVFPSEIPRRAILAGTSPMACPHCGAPWERVVAKVGTNKANEEGIAEMVAKGVPRQKANLYVTRERGHTVTLDWRPTCSCEGNDGSGKCWVLDPFLGSGTTAAVALQHGRAAIGIELNPQYIEIAKRRLCRTQTTLLGML